MLTNIDQDLVNILTDSEQTYRPMGAFSTQLRYKKFMINPFAPGDFAETRVLKLFEWFSGHCRAIKS